MSLIFQAFVDVKDRRSVRDRPGRIGTHQRIDRFPEVLITSEAVIGLIVIRSRARENQAERRVVNEVDDSVDDLLTLCRDGCVESVPEYACAVDQRGASGLKQSAVTEFDEVAGVADEAAVGERVTGQ